MMKNVRNNERPTMIWFGGSCGTPIACRKKDKTMTILVNELMRSRIAGANVRMVRTITILIRFLFPWLPTREPKRSELLDPAA
jgi:hypothetical protein